MKVGTKVRLNEAGKLYWRMHDSADHIEEFGECVGVVQGLADWGSGPVGPDVDVRWEPSGCRYAYDVAHLEEVDP